MHNEPEKYALQFPVQDGARMRDNGLAHFESRAREMAAQKDCILIGITNVKLEFVRGRWSVTGTAHFNKLKAAG